MAVTLRMARFGKNKQPFYRIVAADSRSPRDGRHLEILGTYSPKKNPEQIVLKEQRIKYWLSTGAQISDTVRSILRRHGYLKK